MAHTLSVVDGVEGTTLALAGTAATGYHLSAYNPLMAQYSDQRNSSIYTPGDFSVQGKYGNIIETITCEIVGTSRDDLFVKLRALYRAIENARDHKQNIGIRNPTYLSYKPDSVTNTAYSVILGGRVDIPGVDASITQGAGGEGEQLANTMTGIVITIEREPFWRALPPAMSATVTNWATAWLNTDITTGLGNVGWFGQINADGGTYPLIPGDLPALTEIRAGLRFAGDGLTLDKLVIGYRSARYAGNGAYGAGGLLEAETGTVGIDTAVAADATASPGGGGNTKARCTFATTATDAKRLLMQQSTTLTGSWRVFGRMAMSAGASTATVHLTTLAKGGLETTIPGIATVSGTAWTMYDLGVINAGPGIDPAFDQMTQVFNGIYVFAARTSGAASLDFDCLFLVPVDEYYLTASNMALLSSPSGGTVRLGNITPVSSAGQTAYMSAVTGQYFQQSWSIPQFSGDMRFPPGAGALYYLFGDATWGNIFEATLKIRLYLFYTALYLAARGNG